MHMRIRYKNAQYDIRDRYASYMHIPEYYDYDGVVVDRPKWVKDDSFCLRYGQGKYDYRILKKDNVICGWYYG